MVEKVKSLITSKFWDKFILFVIIINAVCFGLETLSSFTPYKNIISVVDTTCLIIFVIEISLRLLVFRLGFFTDKAERGWNIFDFTVIAVSLFANEYLIFRSFRILRILRVLSYFRSMRLVVNAILHTIPAMFSVFILLCLFMYIYGVLCVNLFAKDFPELFGDLAKSFFTLFQIITFDDWVAGIVQPVMEIYPYSWILFISFIFIVAFIILNLVIGIITNSIEEINQQYKK